MFKFTAGEAFYGYTFESSLKNVFCTVEKLFKTTLLQRWLISRVNASLHAHVIVFKLNFKILFTG